MNEADRKKAKEPSAVRVPSPPEVCDVCGSTDVRERNCKVICGNCRTILKSCADLY